MPPHHIDPLATLAPLLDGTPEEQQRWIDRAAASLSPYLLLAIEQLACAIIDLRYADDPGSLFNWRYRQGQQRKHAIQRLFDAAQARLVGQLLAHAEQVRGDVLAGEMTRLRDVLYLQHRPALLTRQGDELAHAIRVGLAYNPDVQVALAWSEREHQHEIDLERLEAELVRAQTRLDQPHELVLKLLRRAYRAQPVPDEPRRSGSSQPGPGRPAADALAGSDGRDARGAGADHPAQR